MIKNKLFYLIFLVTLILTTSVSAYYVVELGDYHTSAETITRSEFKAHSGLYTTCSGEINVIPIWIKDKQNTKEFSFKLEKNNFAILSGAGFTLNPEQEGVLFITLTPQLDLEEKTVLNLDIFTNDQLTLKLPIELNIMKCYGVDIEIKKETDKICSCELTAYDIEIENKEIFF